MSERVIYVDKGGQVPFRYVRLLTLPWFELAITWPFERSRCGHERWDDETSKWVRCPLRAGHWKKS